MRFNLLRRREFITLLGAAVWAPSARAQESRPVIGILYSAPYAASVRSEDGFAQGLKEAGFIEGKNVTIERRGAEGRYDQLLSLANELVSRGVALIVSFDAPASFAAKAATKTIPIVFGTGADPIKLGLVDSFSRPQGNLTGVSALVSVLGPKRLELLRELLPTATTIGLLVNPANPNVQADIPELRAAAKALGRPLEVMAASSEGDLEAAFRAMAQRQVGALVVMPDPFLVERREQVVSLAARHAIPTIYPLREFAQVGGLMSYGSNLAEAYRQTGIYAGKILAGAKPADLPIQQSAKFEFVINLKTASALGLAVPPSFLARADEVIE